MIMEEDEKRFQVHHFLWLFHDLFAVLYLYYLDYKVDFDCLDYLIVFQLLSQHISLSILSLLRVEHISNDLSEFHLVAPTPKRRKILIESDGDGEEEITPVRLGKNGERFTPCGRPSFGANKVNKKYNNRYRNAENKNKLGGKLMKLGRATGIIAFTLFGYDVSLEAAHSADRLRIFKSAARYALTEE